MTNDMALLQIKKMTIDKDGTIAIPKEFLDAEGFKEVEKVVILVYNNKVEIRHQKDAPRSPRILACERALAEYWDSPEEDEAWKDL